MPNEDPRLKKLLRDSIAGVGESSASQVDALKFRFGLDEVYALGREAVRRNDAQAASEISREIRAFASEAIRTFGRLGYEVGRVGQRYQRMLGNSDFSEAEEVSEGATPKDVMEAVIRSSELALGGLRTLVGSQAEAQAAKRLSGAASLQSPQERVIGEMQAVWAESANETASAQPRLGGRVEELRSGVGLRTLSALLARYGRSDSEGHEDAMPKAYLWAERAYWLTKHSIGALGMRPEYAAQKPDLDGLGLEYEGRLGDKKLAAPGASEFTAGETGWLVVGPAERVSRQTWASVKELLPKD